MSRKKKQQWKPDWARIMQLSKDELCVAYWNLSRYLWDDAVGEKPWGFDDLPTHDRRRIKLKSRRTKSEYVEPILEHICARVPKKTLMRYGWCKIMGIFSEIEFEDRWQSRMMQMLEEISLILL